jgi:hypothetical protein
MKIKYILDNMENEQGVTSFIGTISAISQVKTMPAKGDNPEYKTQSLMLTDSEGLEIRVLLKDIDESKFVHEDSVGQVYEFVSSKSPNGSLSGVVFKEGKKDKYLCVTKRATINRVKDLEASDEEIQSTEKPALKESQPASTQQNGESDKDIIKYTKERLYIYDKVVGIINESDSSFPIEKVPEIATSIHIDLSRKNANILPRVVKPVFAKEKEPEPAAPSKTPINWRNSRDIRNGSKLGEMTKDEAIKQYLTIYFRERKRIASEGEVEKVKFFNSIGAMFEEYGIKIMDAVTSYVGQYVEAIFKKEGNKTPVTNLLVKQKISAYLSYIGVKDHEVTPLYLEELLKDKVAIEAIARFDEAKNKRTGKSS